MEELSLSNYKLENGNSVTITATADMGLTTGDISLTVTLPTELTAPGSVTSASLGGTCGIAGQVITCNYTGLSAGNEPNVVFDATANTLKTGAIIIASTLSTSGVIDPNPTNNIKTKTFDIVEVTDLGVTAAAASSTARPLSIATAFM